MRHRQNILLLVTALLIIALASPTSAQFGRNKIQTKNMDWKVLTTPHFEIHFYVGNEAFAARAALILEDGYVMLSGKLKEELPWRVPVILYGAHNDFLQTNVNLGLINEGVQAFAEPSRKRIVLPFTGTYKSFAHTAIHELAHVFTFHIVYNRLMDNVFSRNGLFGMPLWIAEGVAEYLAVGWDTQADMYIRDAVIHDYLPGLDIGGGYFVYKGGQAAFNYIERTYGREKVLEILDALAITRSANGALEKTVGLTTREFSAQWKKAMRKHYWPIYAEKTEDGEIGRRLTNHIKQRAAYNIKPTISPDGEKIAYFTDKDGLVNIYLMSALDGKVIRKVVTGYRSSKFESLHFFNSAISFSPDSDNLAFIAKSNGRDRLYIVEAVKGKMVKEIKIPSDGLASPSWSPNGREIILTAVFNGQTDLMMVNVESGAYERLTYDVADQLNPRFFPDGKRVVFTHFPEMTVPVPEDLSANSIKTLAEMDFTGTRNVKREANLDIYEYSLETGIMRPIIATRGDDTAGVIFRDGKRMLFTSDDSGVNNLYVADLDTGEYRRITDVLSGVFTPDINEDNNRLVFASFVQGGWDLYISDDLQRMTENNFSRPLLAGLSMNGTAVPDNGQAGIPMATLMKRQDLDAKAPGSDRFTMLQDAADEENKKSGEERFSVADADSAEYFANSPNVPTLEGEETADAAAGGPQVARAGEIGSDGLSIEGVNTPVSGKEPRSKGASVSNYRLRLAPDFVGQGAGVYFASGVGFGLANTIAMSDMLGNHRAIVSFNIYRDITQSDVLASYYYLKRRINYGMGVFQYSNFLNSRVSTIGESFTDYRLFSERNYGVFGSVSLPLNQFKRIDLELQAFVSERQFFEQTRTDPETGLLLFEESGKSSRNLVEPSISLVHDATFYSYFGPMTGSRWLLSVSKATGYGQSAVSRASTYIDYRRYFNVFHRNVLAFRGAFAASEGPDARNFFLGGPTTLRGYDYLAFDGNRMAIFSAEYRFPFVDALILGWPGRWGIGNLGGSVFADVGSAWDDGDIRFLQSSSQVNGIQFQDVYGDVGFGVNMWMGYFLLNLQWAWKTDMREIYGSQFHFYLGPTF